MAVANPSIDSSFTRLTALADFIVTMPQCFWIALFIFLSSSLVLPFLLVHEPPLLDYANTLELSSPRRPIVAIPLVHFIRAKEAQCWPRLPSK